jgi:hypothetical protein
MAADFAKTALGKRKKSTPNSGSLEHITGGKEMLIAQGMDDPWEATEQPSPTDTTLTGVSTKKPKAKGKSKKNAFKAVPGEFIIPYYIDL